jgi:hypothetical protein
MVEGRDHWSGDSFIMVGSEDERGEDIYITVGTQPASMADQDFIAAARQDIERLLREVERLRQARGRSKLAVRPKEARTG